MRKITFFIFVFVLVFFTISVTEVSAKVLTNRDGDVNIAKTEVINDDLFIGAQNTTIDGTVNGDIFAGGGNVTINGIVNGNLHVGAGIVTLRGKIKGNVYIGSGNVTISESIIGGSLLVGAGSVNIDKKTAIGGSVIAGTGSITLDSQVKRSIYLGAGSATIGSNAKIGKDLYYAVNKNGKDINMVTGAVVSGNVYKTSYQPASAPTIKVPQNAGLVMKILSFIGALIVGFVYFRLCKVQFTEAANLTSKAFWKSLGIGFLVTIGAIPALLVAMITVVGMPLAGITFLVFLLGLYFAKIVVAIALGNWITVKLKWNELSPYWIFAIGLVVIYILKFIPVLGGFVSIVVVWTGLGALILHFFSKAK